MSKIRKSHTKKQNAAKNTTAKRDVRQAFVTKTKQKRSVNAKLAQLTVQVNNQHAELQATHQLGSASAPTTSGSFERNITAVGDLAEVLRGL